MLIREKEHKAAGRNKWRQRQTEARKAKARKLKAEGLSNIEVARRLGIHRKTVAGYVGSTTKQFRMPDGGPTDWSYRLDALCEELPFCDAVNELMLEWTSARMPPHRVVGGPLARSDRSRCKRGLEI